MRKQPVQPRGQRVGTQGKGKQSESRVADLADHEHLAYLGKYCILPTLDIGCPAGSAARSHEVSSSPLRLASFVAEAISTKKRHNRDT
jgi:hypothetical protein